LFSKKLKKEG